MNLLRCIAVATAVSLFRFAHADDACSGFKWDVTHEHALFLGMPTTATAARDDATAPALESDRLYDLTLSAQDGVKFAAAPSKKMLADGAYAGLVHFHVAQAGRYRVSLGTPFWIDLVADGKAIPSIDFNGAQGCDKPRKIVVYELPGGRDLTLQLSGMTETHVRVALTAVAAPAK
jgi:hypothetical protein